MRPLSTARWNPASALRATLAPLALAALTVAALAAAGRAAERVTVPARGVRPAVTVARRPAGASAGATATAARPAAPAEAQASPWTNLGPFNLNGRVHCATSRILEVPIVDVGSDGNGYWRGYALMEAGWDARGQQFGTGVLQLTNNLVFPEGGGYFERRLFEGVDGQLRTTDDDGITTAPVTQILAPGHQAVPGRCRIASSDRWSNVVYLLARVYDTGAGDTAYVFEQSFDSGSSFYEVREFFANSADFWISRNNDGQMVLAYDDADHVVTVSVGNEDGWTWSDLPSGPDTQTASQYGPIAITGQSAGALSRVWVDYGDSLWSTQDGGVSWTGVAPSFVPGGPRGLCASITVPDLLLWTDSQGSRHFSRTYWSADGGVTAHEFIQPEVPDDPSTMSDHGTNIDVRRWVFASTPSFLTRTADGAVTEHQARTVVADGARPADADAIEERFYISSGRGLFMFTPGDTVAPRVGGYGMVNLEVEDLATQSRGDGLDMYIATRDFGLLGSYAIGPSAIDASIGVWSSGGNDISDLATRYGPDPADLTYFAQFNDNMLLIGGGGPFNAVYAPGGYTFAHHRMLVADPDDDAACYWGSDLVYHIVYDVFSETFDIQPAVTDEATLHGGAAGYGIAPSDHARRYFAARDGALFYSTDGGSGWTLAAGTAPGVMDADELDRVKFVIHPDDPLEAWCIGASVVHTTDGGAHWTEAITGLPPGDPRAFDGSYDGTPLNHLYLAAASGAYRWNGIAWVPLWDATVPAVQFRAVEARPYQGVMRYGTWGAGVWDFATGIALDAGPAPTVVALALAPRRNPARGAVALDFALPRAGHVTLEVLDLAGRRVATLVDGLRPAGSGAATFDPSGGAAGVYFARLRTEQGARTAKLVVTR
jgi:hypothetical protein